MRRWSVQSPPRSTVVGRLDEVKAAKRAVVRYLFEDHPDLSGDPAPVGVEAPKGV